MSLILNLNFDNNSKYLIKKYLLEFGNTVSISKLEKQILENKADPRMKKIASVYCYINGIEPSRFKHKNMYEHFIKVKENMDSLIKENDRRRFQKENIEYKDFFNYVKKEYKKMDMETYKIFKTIYLKTNKTDIDNDIKEIFRKEVEKFIDESKMTISEFVDFVSESKIDNGNFYKFLKKKEYNKISFEKIQIIRNIISNGI